MWVLNVFLYFLFVIGMRTGDFTEYNNFVEAGAPCYEQVLIPGLPVDEGPAPACWYDPSNTNPGN